MNYSLMISSCGFAAIMVMLIAFNYRMENDIVTCKRCPYSNSPNCWDCRRKFNIKENKYNKKK